MAKKLLFITPIFPKNDIEDSVVPFITQFTNNFADIKNVKIDVISLMYPFSSKKYTIGNITVYPIGSNFKTFFWQIPYLLKAIFYGWKLNQKENYDGILCFWYRESALVGKVLNFLISKKLAVWMLGQDINKANKFISFLKIPLENLVLMSAQQRDLFLEYHNIKVDKIANVAVTQNLFPEFNHGERKIAILGVGNLGVLKNYSLFVEIISKLENQKCNAVIIGEGEQMETLQNKCRILGLENRISFVGHKSHTEVLDYMNNAKIFLHTSKSEGGGTVLQEALFSGCKVVSTIAIETSLDENNFYFHEEKTMLINKVDNLLNTDLKHIRFENFKMGDTVEVIYKSFYKD